MTKVSSAQDTEDPIRPTGESCPCSCHMDRHHSGWRLPHISPHLYLFLRRVGGGTLGNVTIITTSELFMRTEYPSVGSLMFPSLRPCSSEILSYDRRCCHATHF